MTFSTTAAASFTTDRCHVCRDQLGSVRHSRRHGIDVGLCPQCGTVSVLGAGSVVATDLAATDNSGVDTDWAGYDASMHTDEAIRHQVLDRLRDEVTVDGSRLTLFDVGAGTGAFLDIARTRGFDVTGNDISRSSIAYARQRYGIELSSRPLEEQPPQSADALTMWCVIAHVGDPATFLTAAFDVLRPGGLLFLRTPRWCLADRVGQGIARATRGRVSQLPDHRVTRGHLHLYRDSGMERLLGGLGFTDVEVRPTAHTGCTGAEIARRLGGPGLLQRWSSRAVDRAMDSSIAPRNSMFVYARRPHDS